MNILKTNRYLLREHDSGNLRFPGPTAPALYGKYHVNPAQVSLMYFPVINANTALEEVKIEE